MNTATERLCRYCGDPLPPLKGRSRPRVAHEGECSRKYHNKRRLNWRIARFRAAFRADRSDALPWAASQYNDDDYDPEGFSTSRGAFDDVHGDALIEAMNAWELAETARKALARVDGEADYARWLAEDGATASDEEREVAESIRKLFAPDPRIAERERHYAAVRASVTAEEWDARLAERRAEWLARVSRD